ncbi:MAG: HD domain-containing protein [Proteobacteria bacterium]|nr:HD domain-containing protein [Pseudomonadota bacterium]
MEDFFKERFKKIFDMMDNSELKEKTINAWVTAAKEGGWSTEKIDKIPFTLLTDTKGINLIEHTIAVTLGAYGLAKAIESTYKKMPFEINYDFLLAGGLLHDVGKLLEIEESGDTYRKSRKGKCARHPISGAIIADRVGLPDEIINIIANHSKEGDGRPQRIETVFVHQADFATFNPMVMKEKGLLIE